MARRERESRAQRRARRAAEVPPAARVYALSVVDAVAETWTSEVVVFAESPARARGLAEAAGFFGRNSTWLDAGVARGSEYAFAEQQPEQLFLRRGHDDPRTPWMPLPAGYRHPGKGEAAEDPRRCMLAGEGAVDEAMRVRRAAERRAAPGT